MGHAGRLYVLNDRLRLLSAELTRDYESVYESIRREWPLVPPFDPHPDRHLYPMLRWEDGRFVHVDGLERTRAPAAGGQRP